MKNQEVLDNELKDIRTQLIYEHKLKNQLRRCNMKKISLPQIKKLVDNREIEKLYEYFWQVSFRRHYTTVELSGNSKEIQIKTTDMKKVTITNEKVKTMSWTEYSYKNIEVIIYNSKEV